MTPTAPIIGRFGDLHPFRTASIDARTPRSNARENFTTIGSDLSKPPDRHVPIAAPHAHDRPSMPMPVRGHRRLTWGCAADGQGGQTGLAPGDTASGPAALLHAAIPAMQDEAAPCHAVGTDDRAGPSSPW